MEELAKIYNATKRGTQKDISKSSRGKQIASKTKDKL